MSKEDGNRGLLAFFGMETLGKTCETFACILPIAAIMVVALGVISWIANWAGLSLSPRNYAIAIGIAVAISFFTLARLRVMNLSPKDEENEAD